MTRTIPLLLFIAITSPALAQTPLSEKNGKVVFEKWCGPCHGAISPVGGTAGTGLAGTSALAVKYKGKLPAVLEERTDLTSAYIRYVVRNGLFGMPISRKTEISDAEVEDIAAYLTRKR